MRYLQHRKERIGFLLLMVSISLLWPFLAKVSMDAQEFCLYVAGFLTPALPLYYVRRRTVKALQKLSKVIVYNWACGFVMVVCTIGMGVLSVPYMKILFQGDIRILGYLYWSAIPCIGAYLFEIKKPVLVLLMTMVLLAGCSPLAGVILGVCVCFAVLPANAYPPTPDELLTMQEIPEDLESESLYIFTRLAQKDDIIPTLEKYVSFRSNKFLGYHYLLHMSHALESTERFKCRVSEAESALDLPEIEILFSEPQVSKSAKSVI